MDLDVKVAKVVIVRNSGDARDAGSLLARWPRTPEPTDLRLGHQPLRLLDNAFW